MSSSLNSEESSGQLQHVTINELISQGFDAEDVKKLQDAGIVTCNDLMIHTEKNFEGLCKAKVDQIREAAEKLENEAKVDQICEELVNSAKIEGLSTAKVNQICDAAKALVNLAGIKGLSKAKFDQICETAKKFVDFLKTLVTIDNREVTVPYENFENIISHAVKARPNEKIVFKLNNGETLEQGKMKPIVIKIKNSNDKNVRNDEFMLEYVVNLEKKEKKGKKVHDIIKVK